MKYTKLLCLLLTAVLLLSACGGTGAATPTTDTTAAPTTEATEPETTAAPAIDNEETLTAELQTKGMATLEADIALTKEAVVNGGLLEGAGYTLTGPVYTEGDVTTENGLTVTGGTVQNVTVVDAYRCIGDSKDNPKTKDVRLNNVTVDGGSYALNFGYGSADYGLYVTECTLNGWTSYTKCKEAVFTDCTFGWGNSKSTANLRPYIDTTLMGCRFEGKTEADGTYVPFNIMFKADSSGVTLVLENCYAGDTLITQENLEELLHVDAYGNTIMVRNRDNHGSDLSN